MANIKEILKNIIQKFGRKEIGLGDSKQLESYLQEARNVTTTEFDEKLKVEGIQSTVDRDIIQTDYKKLDRESSKKIEVFFKGITESQFYAYEEIEGNEGVSSNGEPFKCYAEIDGNGNLIVTPSKAIRIDKKDKDNGEYSETRQKKDGTYETIRFKKTHGDITGYSYHNYNVANNKQCEKFEKLSEFYSEPNNLKRLEMSRMNEQEKIVYTQELQKLGIKDGTYKSPEEMDKQEYEKIKTVGEMRRCCHESSYTLDDEFKTLCCMFKPGEETPESIWSAEAKDGKQKKFSSYRKTANGKYLDTGSFKIVNGKPVYNLLEYDQVLEKIQIDGHDIDILYSLRGKMDNQLNGEFPKEAEKITDRASRTREHEQEGINEDNPYPSFPTDRV